MKRLEEEQMQFGDWLPYKRRPDPEPSSTLRGVATPPPDIHYEIWYMHDGFIIDKYISDELPRSISPRDGIVAIEDGVMRPLTPLERNKLYRR